MYLYFVTHSLGVNTWFFISFACPKETKQRKRHFFEGIFWFLTKKRVLFSKFPPRFRKFLTKIKLYADKKDNFLCGVLKKTERILLF